MKTQVMENRHNLANFIPKSEACNSFESRELAEQGKIDPAGVGAGSQSSSVSAPSTEDWPGKHNFTISFKEKGTQNGKIHSWLWSEELQKLFVEMNKPCPFDVKATNYLNEQLFVRALPLYTTATNVLRVVKRCPNHASLEDATNIGNGFLRLARACSFNKIAFEDVPEHWRQHLIRAECGSAVYEEDPESKRLSVKLPLGRPEPGANWTTLLFKFMCLGSCVGGINRRALQVIFTLETASGEVVGRQCIGVRICACPSRDRKVEERKFEMNTTGDLVIGIPTGPHHLLPLSRKRSGSVNSNPSLNPVGQRDFLCPKAKPKIENCYDDNVYIIKVRCYANYLLLKEIAFALEVKQHASEMYPNLIDEIGSMFGDNERLMDEFPEKDLACKRAANVCSSTPSSNPASGCVSPDSEAQQSFPPPHPHNNLLAASKAVEAERNKLKRSMSHCASMLTNPRVTQSGQTPMKQVCRRPDEGKSGEVKNNVNSSSTTSEEGKLSGSDGLYILAEQADRLARDSSGSDNSRCTSPELKGIRLRASSMSATDVKYRERILHAPTMKSCQVQTEAKRTEVKTPHLSGRPSPPLPLYIARLKQVPVQVKPQQQQQHQRPSHSVCIEVGSPGTGPGNKTQKGDFPDSCQPTMKSFMESLGMGDFWLNYFENRPQYQSWSATAFACWSEEDFGLLGIEKRVAQFLISKLARFKPVPDNPSTGTTVVYLLSLHSNIFTPREYQVELVNCAIQRNIIVCLGSATAKFFIATSVIRDLGHQVRDKSECPKFTIVLAVDDSGVTHFMRCINRTCNLAVESCLMEGNQASDVLVTLTDIFLELLKNRWLSVKDVNLLVLDDCHNAVYGSDLAKALRSFTVESHHFPSVRLLGLTASILGKEAEPYQVQDCILTMERELGSRVEAASEITSILRLSSKCREIIVECDEPQESDLSIALRKVVWEAIDFIDNHVYNPCAIYGEEMLKEYFPDMPDPGKEPLSILYKFLEILDCLGPWAAFTMAVHLMIETETLKKKTPHERHYLLLCVVFTILVKIRAICDDAFKAFSPVERVFRFSSPRTRRLIEILHQYKLSEAAEASSDIFKDMKVAIEKPVRGTGISIEFAKTFATEKPRQPKSLQSLSSRLLKTNNVPLSNKLLLCLDWLQVLGASGRVTDVVEVKSSEDEAEGAEPNTRSNFHTRRKRRKHKRHDVEGVGKTSKTTEKMDRIKSFYDPENPRCLSCLVFVDKKCIAKGLFHILRELSCHHPDFWMMMPLFTAGKTSGEPVDFVSREAEIDHKKQEEVLRRFRMHECNVLVSTSVLEEGADIPRANLVVRFDVPSNFPSYVNSMGRCRNVDANYVHLVIKRDLESYLNAVAKYRVMSEILLGRCYYHETPVDNEVNMEKVDSIFPPYIPGEELNVHSLKKRESRDPSRKTLPMSKAVALVNRYCAKLPSDTFTRLTPLWRLEKIQVNGLVHSCFKCSLRLPINCPFKGEVEGPVMPTEGLAKMAAAQNMCRVLREHNELDESLVPVGKEAFRDLDIEIDSSDEEVGDSSRPTVDKAGDLPKEERPRPGTTKRRQYYYKKVSDVFKDSTPEKSHAVMLYKLALKLACPIPEEHNTRGRRIHAPESAVQTFGVLTTRPIPNISGFPIFTRSGEVGVKVHLITDTMRLTEEELAKVSHFHVFTFKEVLRLEKYPMMFEPHCADMGFYVVPLISGSGNIDWNFVERIHGVFEIRPKHRPEDDRKNFVMDADAWVDSVVMPWYRSQDQPQYFYVAEICSSLNPRSRFPDEDFESFEKYYLFKYKIQIQNLDQPLLDVDLTSARLNLLTPRYVNRKGVALPTCSEATKKARRENLQQKVILVPELCDRHPFPASLWRQAVCLPCILYRMNCLLLADELRSRVAADMKFGLVSVPTAGFEWPELGFGWSLADVIKKQKEKVAAREKERCEKSKAIEKTIPEIAASLVDQESAEASLSEDNDAKSDPDIVSESVESVDLSEVTPEVKECPISAEVVPSVENLECDGPAVDVVEDIQCNGQASDIANVEDIADIECGAVSISNGEDGKIEPTLADKEKLRVALKNMMEIGTWSNEMADRSAKDGKDELNGSIGGESDDELDFYDSSISLPMNLEMITRVDDAVSNSNVIQSTFRYGSPSNFETGGWGSLGDAGDGWGEAEASIHPWGVRTSNWDSLMKDLDGMMDSSESDWGDEDEDDFPDIEFKDSNTAEAKDFRNRGQSVANGFTNDSDIYIEPREELDWEGPTDLEEGDGRMVELKNDVESRVEEMMRRLMSDETESCVVRVCDRVEMFQDKTPSCASNKSCTIFEDLSSLELLVRECENYEIARRSRKKSESVNSVMTEDLYFRAHGVITPRGIENENWVKFDDEADPDKHPGPNPSILLQALTMSNANDGINLERLETVGDSFLKFSVTTFLFLSYPDVHEGKLSYLRSRQVSNVHLYRLGKRRGLGERMVATKFEPHDNWLPPGYCVPPELEQALIESGVPEAHWNLAELPDFTRLDADGIRAAVKEKSAAILGNVVTTTQTEVKELDLPCFLPYNLLTQHSIPDKSVADCVEALIGAYLTSCGMRGALLFMSWLGLRVLPVLEETGCVMGMMQTKKQIEPEKTIYGMWEVPCSNMPKAEEPRIMLDELLDGYESFEELVGYRFRNRMYLLQAFTHASFSTNHLTDCYQRLEFLGDAVLDYLITRHLYEDPRRHSPGALTDLRSALVNNTIFASLAVKYDFHKYFKHLSPGLWTVVEKFVAMQEENKHEIAPEFYWLEEEDVEEAEDDPRRHSPGALTDLRSALVNNTIFASLAVKYDFHKYFKHLSPGLWTVVEKFVAMQEENKHEIAPEFYWLEEEDVEEAEDVEVPKALGDVFESVAGAIYLDSGLSLDAVWTVYYRLMCEQIERFSSSVPKSPIRELLEMEPETAKFGKPERLLDGRVRVSVEVFGKGTFRGIGRNYRIAKSTAAKCALRALKKRNTLSTLR
ncbi:unnamed protein product [Notodromas monacha]|uniref:ribonuclease III n=1 Tax=Notodromas monacha TaxID=399045 RepID=A0A7R9BIV3_9CRUS|nr:unnamed protein product [Notodromas monacha]CAG0914915.1 unnamed protein product [Notodromas monacha]